MQKLAIIDFDKTFVKIDSSFYFVKKYSAWNIMFLGVLRKLRLISRKQLTYKVSEEMSKRLTKEEIEAFIEYFKGMINPVIMNKIKELKGINVKVVVVSAAPNMFIKQFCKLYQLDAYGSYLNPEGDFEYLYGEGKLKFVKENFLKEQYEYFFTVSDSYSDKPLFDAFQNSFLFKNNELIRQ